MCLVKQTSTLFAADCTQTAYQQQTLTLFTQRRELRRDLKREFFCRAQTARYSHDVSEKLLARSIGNGEQVVQALRKARGRKRWAGN